MPVVHPDGFLCHSAILLHSGPGYSHFRWQLRSANHNVASNFPLFGCGGGVLVLHPDGNPYFEI